MKSISLFSGMGGDTLGMTQANCEVIAFNEFDCAAIKSHKANFPNSTILCAPPMDENERQLYKSTLHGDKKEINHAMKLYDKKKKDIYNIQNIPDNIFSVYNVDLIFAGHPCQGFSNGGKKITNDPRNSLFLEFIRCAKLIQPKYIIGENVDGLLTKKTDSGEKYIDVIVNEFESIGYTISYKICHMVKYGIPQLRKRLIYVGIRKDLNKKYVFPKELPSLNPNLKDIIQFNMEGSIKIEKEDFDMTLIPPECILTNMENNEEGSTNPHPYLVSKAKTRNKEYNGKVHYSMLSFSKRDSPIHCEIIDIRNPCKTIICTYDHQPRLFVPLKNKKGYYLRCILPDELKQIQGFPPDFTLVGTNKDKIKQIGNAVPPPMVKQIVELL